MCSRESERIISQIFLTIAHFERSLDITRQVLAEVNLFEPDTAFQRIDKDHKSQITAKDLLKFMRSNSYENEDAGMTTLDECQLCIDAYDDNEDQSLDFQEFLYLILPARNPRMRQQALSRDPYILETGIKLPFDVEYAIVRIILQEI